MAIVGLDISGETGVAAWYSGGHDPVLDTIHLGGIVGEVAHSMERLRVGLLSIHQQEPITHLFIEKTILPKMTTQATVFKLNAWAGMAEWFGVKVEAIVRMVEQQDWRAHFFLGKAGKGTDAKKAASLLAARARGWTPANDHEADAAGVLDYGCACFNIKTPWRDRHLLGGAAVFGGVR